MRPAMRCACTGAWLALAGWLGQAPAFAADADHGQRIARRWCSSCHVVAANQRRATSEAPPFASIAGRPDFDAGKTAVFLMNPHPKMPDMHLSWKEVADIAAYIATLR
jgi:mono/diheme cytochrome c family protein